jgi:hypothetical protein
MAKGVLRNLRIKRVAIVDLGANLDPKTGDGAHVMLWKSVQKESPSLGSVHVDTAGGEDEDEYETEYEKRNLDSKARNSLPDSAFAAVWTDAKGEKHRKLPIHDAGHLAAARGRISQAAMPADVKAKAQRKIDAATNKEKPVKKTWKGLLKQLIGASAESDEKVRREQLTAISKAASSMTDDDEDEEDEEDDEDEEDEKDTKKFVHKAGDPMCKCADCVAKRAANPMMASMMKRFTDLEKKLSDSEARTTAAEMIAKGLVEKAERDAVVLVLKSFRAVPVNMETDIDQFCQMKKVAPKVFERTIAIMKATDEQLAQSALFKMHGLTGAQSSGDAWAQIEAKADAMMQKSSTPMTKPMAIDLVLQDPSNNVLVKQYREQQQ